MSTKALSPQPRSAANALTPAQIAWLAVLPCAIVTVLAIVLLGPPLGHAFFEPAGDRFWPSALVAPEPVEHARYAIALLGALLPAGIAAVASRRSLTMAGPAANALVTMSQALLVVVLALGLMAQHDLLLRVTPPGLPGNGVFNGRTLALAAALVALLLALGRQVGVRRRAAHWMREPPGERIACLAVAVVATALVSLAAVSSDATVGNAPGNNLVPWDMSETFAILDGRTPLVDFHAQYTQLWPYVTAAVMALFGSTVLVWTITMAVGSTLALLAIHAVLRRASGSAPLALLLYLSLLALGSAREDVLAAMNVFSLWPLRLAGPFLLAWLTARHVEGLTPRGTWVVCSVAGLVLLNNVEFGSAAFVATFAALACGRARRDLGRLVVAAVTGLLGATALVAAVTLARSGRLPDLSLLLEFSRIYGVGGWVLVLMPVMGLHVAMYVTFAAAVTLAAVRVVQRADGAALTSMLAWSGVFGLVAGGYYVGRSDSINLISLFVPWGFALMLLAIVVVRELAARAWRRPTVAQLAVLFGVALAVCSAPQLPAPWAQVARLRAPTPTPVYKQLDALQFVGRSTRPGERVLILILLGHRIAYDLGLTNVGPYAGIESMPTAQQLQTAMDMARREGARKVFLSTDSLFGEPFRALGRAGFRPARQDGPFYELTDVSAFTNSSS